MPSPDPAEVTLIPRFLRVQPRSCAENLRELIKDIKDEGRESGVSGLAFCWAKYVWYYKKNDCAQGSRETLLKHNFQTKG